LSLVGRLFTEDILADDVHRGGGIKGAPRKKIEWRLDRAHQRASGFFRLKAVQVYFPAALRSSLLGAKSSSYSAGDVQ